MSRRLASFAACLCACLAATDAGAVSNGVEAAADDPGTRASVIVSTGIGTCSGLVFGDSFILTAGHCLLGRDLKTPIARHDLTITYGLSLKQPDAPTRQADAFIIHENYLKQLPEWLNGGDTPFADLPINEEDIGVIRIAGNHPPGALGATLPPIDNEYAICCIPRERTWPLVWLDVYGFGAAPKGETLHKARVSAPAPDMVRPGKEPNPDQPYLPRQLLVEPGMLPPDTAVTPPQAGGICHGDSGGAAFFVTTSRSYAVPNAPLKLVGGQPLAIGLVSHTRSGADCSETFFLMRLDYYRDWILARVKQLQ